MTVDVRLFSAGQLWNRAWFVESGPLLKQLSLPAMVAIPIPHSQSGLTTLAQYGSRQRAREAFFPELVPGDFPAGARAIEGLPRVDLDESWRPFTGAAGPLIGYPRAFRATLQKLHEFQRRRPEVPLIPSHCQQSIKAFQYEQ